MNEDAYCHCSAKIVPHRHFGLAARCEAAGLVGADATSAIVSYLAHGPMTVADQEMLLHLDGPGRVSYYSQRWGSDGGRVAALVAPRREVA